MFVTVNGVRLFFDCVNPKLEITKTGLTGKPALVCIPGGPGGDHQTMRPFFDRFADVAQVIYLDPRGGGRSEHGDMSGWTLDQWGDDIAAVADALGLERPVVLGVSGGSLMVQSYLARHPEHAGGAVLINACSRMTQDGLVATYERFGGPEAGRAARAMYGQPTAEDYAAFFQHCLPLYSARRDLSSLSEGRQRTTMNRAATEHFFAPGGGEAFRYDHRSRLGQVACPVLVLAGAQDPCTPAEWGREVAEALPAGGTELHVLEGASHLIAADEPGELTRLVTGFIGRLAG